MTHQGVDVLPSETVSFTAPYTADDASLATVLLAGAAETPTKKPRSTRSPPV